MGGWWLALITADALYYLFHRASHTLSWMWTAHVVHHSSEEYNLTTALRQPFLDFLTPSNFISQIPMALLFPWQIASTQAVFNLLWQFWLHTQLIPPLPRWELIMNSPSLHRIHHGRNIRALGKNYGAIFSIWDRMGGTFESEISDEDKEPVYYGIVPALHSWDPLWANLVHWYHLLVVQPKWHGLKSPLVKWTPPGGKCPKLGSKMNPKQKFDVQPTVSHRLWTAYAVFQFIVALVLAVTYVAMNQMVLKALGLLSSDKVAKHLSRVRPTDGGAKPWSAEFFVQGGVGLAVFLSVLWILSSGVGSAMSVSAKNERRVVLLELGRHTALLAILLGLLVSNANVSPGTSAAVLLGYAAIHAAFLAPIWYYRQRRTSLGDPNLNEGLLPVQEVGPFGGTSEKSEAKLRNRGWKPWYKESYKPPAL